MVKRIIVFSLLLVLSFSIISFATVSGNKIIDNANLFNQDEIERLQELAKRIEEKHNINILIATSNDLKGKSTEAYIDDLYGKVIGNDVDGTGIIINMQNRQVHINTAGKAINVLDDDRLDEMLDAVIANGLKSGNYANGMQTYINMVDNFFVMGPKNNNIIVPREQRDLNLYEILGSFVASLLSGFGFFKSVKHRYKVKDRGYVFSLLSHANEIYSGPEDTLINEHVTTRLIPRSSSKRSGSRSTTHRSSSGGTFGGKGKGF